jgi:hypothetical protein
VYQQVYDLGREEMYVQRKIEVHRVFYSMDPSEIFKTYNPVWSPILFHSQLYIYYEVLVLLLALVDIFFSKISFLGAFANLIKVAVSFVVPVRLSVRVEQLGSHWKDLHEILYMSIFRKSGKKNIVSLKSDENNRYFA